MILLDSGILDFNLTLVLQLVIFIIAVVVLWKLAWGPLTRVLETREQRIEGGLRAAEESQRRLTAVQADVEKLLDEARVQAREILARAQREASAEAEANRARVRQEAESLVDRARTEIAAERDRAVGELRAQVGGLVVAAAGRVLGQTIDAAVHRRLIEESLEQFAGSGTHG